MHDSEPQTDAFLLDQVCIIDSPHALRLDHTLDQPFVFSQLGFQAIRAASLGTSKSTNALGVATISNSHSDTSFKSGMNEIPDFPTRRRPKV